MHLFLISEKSDFKTLAEIADKIRQNVPYVMEIISKKIGILTSYGNKRKMLSKKLKQ